MLALPLLALVPLAMWGGQSWLRWRAGLPLRWRISTGDLSAAARSAHRTITKLAFGAVLVLYPLLRGVNPLRYYISFMPLHGAQQAALGAALAVLYLALLYLVWMLTGNVQFEVRHSWRKIARRLALAPLTAIFIALVEELLFRAMLLADLLRTLPPVAALVLGTAVFAAAHYVRSVKRYWTFGGHLALGALFCVSFYRTEMLWLSLGLHAGGVAVLMGVRPLVRYSGPAWLVGASIFPYAGAVGIATLVLLTINAWLVGGTS